MALLAFIGSAWSSIKIVEALPEISAALLLYVFGVLAAAVAAGATYLSQAGYGNEFGKASRCVGYIGHVLAVVGVLASYILFGWGSWLAYLGIVS